MPALVTIRDVEIARVGTWETSTGVWTCTREQIAGAVEAADSGLFPRGVLKIGHTDGRFNAGDGEPAIGVLQNVHASEDGDTLLCDLVGVPAWLAEVMRSAYPSRSIECSLGVVTNSGKTFPMVVTGLALLGVTAPAVKTLADIADLYEVSTAVEDYVAAMSVAACTYEHPEDPVPDTPADPIVVQASASIHELCEAAEKWMRGRDEFGDWPYLAEIRTDTLIVDADGSLWQASWSETGAGAFTFGDPSRVRVVYEEVADTPAAVAAAMMSRPIYRAVRSDRGRGSVTASDPQEQQMADFADTLRERLGLAEDATEDEILAAVEAARTTAESTTPPAPDPVAPPADSGHTDQPLPVAASAADREQYQAEIRRLSAEVAQIRASQAEDIRSRVIDGALADGKITPADRASWEARYDKAPDVITDILASMAPGTAMPIAASGKVGSEPGAPSFDDEVTDLLAKAWPSDYGQEG